MPDLLIKYRPLGASTTVRADGAIWSDGPKRGTKWVIPGSGPRRYILVRKEARTRVWIEVSE